MTLRARLAFLALACLSVWLLGVGVSVVAVRSWARSLDVRREVLLGAADVAGLRLALSDQETGVRGYVITGLDTSLQPYRRGVADEARLLNSLRTFSSQSGQVTTDYSALKASIEQWRSTVAEPAIHGRTEPAGDQAAIFAASGLDKQLFDSVREELDKVAADIQADGRRTTGDASNAMRRAVVALIATIAAIGLMAVAASVALRRWVTMPLEEMTRRARRIMAGEATEMKVGGAVEFRELAAAVEDMKATISAQRDTALRARESVEQNALLAFHVRRELETSLGEFPPGWTVAAGLRSAEGVVAGDCYEISLVGPTTIAIVVIDIAGHGAAHAIAAMKCKELLRVALRAGRQPGDAITWLHDQRPLEDGFLTAFVALVDTNRGVCRYANAGHPPPKLLTPNGMIELMPTGPLLGPINGRWDTVAGEMVPGSKLALYTDGVTEARNIERDFFGEDRLVASLHASRDEEAEASAKLILDDLGVFTGDLRLADDATLIVVCRALD